MAELPPARTSTIELPPRAAGSGGGSAPDWTEITGDSFGALSDPNSVMSGIGYSGGAWNLQFDAGTYGLLDGYQEGHPYVSAALSDIIGADFDWDTTELHLFMEMVTSVTAGTQCAVGWCIQDTATNIASVTKGFGWTVYDHSATANQQRVYYVLTNSHAAAESGLTEDIDIDARMRLVDTHVRCTADWREDDGSWQHMTGTEACIGNAVGSDPTAQYLHINAYVITAAAIPSSTWEFRLYWKALPIGDVAPF